MSELKRILSESGERGRSQVPRRGESVRRELYNDTSRSTSLPPSRSFADGSYRLPAPDASRWDHSHAYVEKSFRAIRVYNSIRQNIRDARTYWNNGIRLNTDRSGRTLRALERELQRLQQLDRLVQDHLDPSQGHIPPGLYERVQQHYTWSAATQRMLRFVLGRLDQKEPSPSSSQTDKRSPDREGPGGSSQKKQRKDMQ